MYFGQVIIICEKKLFDLIFIYSFFFFIFINRQGIISKISQSLNEQEAQKLKTSASTLNEIQKDIKF